MKKYNLIMAGVGGQGVILAGNIIGEVALASGYDVKKTDTLGMAQRGGSVVSHLRIADKVFSPLIKQGEADILLAFEKLEAARWSTYLKPGGVAIINNQALPPLSVNLGNERYPDNEEIIGIIRQQTENLYIVEGSSKAGELGNLKTLNIFMLGCLSQFTPFSEGVWQDCITQNLPSGVIDINISAFKIGMREIEDMINEKRGTRDA
ncbi:MAG: indolepyruvate oxidoreductase subunit beta [Dehalococcoidales bacterium]|nr:indolepyruvate oxidoreductase subunit beta [Dehalococcoidales bacterium]